MYYLLANYYSSSIYMTNRACYMIWYKKINIYFTINILTIFLRFLRQSYTSVVGKIFNHRIFAWQKDGHRILDSVRRLSFWDCRMTCYMLVPTQCNEADDNRKSDKINMRSVGLLYSYLTNRTITPRSKVNLLFRIQKEDKPRDAVYSSAFRRKQ